MLTLAALFFGYVTFLILGPALYWGLRCLLPDDGWSWTLGGVAYLSRNLSLVAMAVLCAWGVLGRGRSFWRLPVVVLGGTWIWMAYLAGLMLINRPRSDTAIALFTFGTCVAIAAGVLRAFTGWRVTTPLDEVSAGHRAWQFQLREVLLGMAVLGATLAALLRLPTDMLGFFPDVLRYGGYVSFWEDAFWHFIVPLPIVFACLVAPSLGGRYVALALAVTLLFILLEPIVYFLVIDPQHSIWEDNRYWRGLRWFAIQRLELALLCLATVAILQRIGFRPTPNLDAL